MKYILLFLVSNLTYANFDIAYEVLNCNLAQDNCEVRVEFSTSEVDSVYINSCYEINPTPENIQFCIEDLEVRASRIYNNL